MTRGPGPFPASLKLTDQVAEALIRHIADHQLKPGDRLPAITELCEMYRVSPTVVRESLARLRSEGIVETRQGSGAFVMDGTARPFRIASDGLGFVLKVLELRLGPESEAAALAAQRARPAEIRRIRAALDRLAKAIHAGQTAVDEDLAFHQAIAAAAGNALFVSFTAFLQQHLRDGIGISHRCNLARGALHGVVAEHERILAAITAHDAEAAREAARSHLQAGMVRLQTALAEAARALDQERKT
jgi:GntR family transcriptional repressor for pyruvate dehydrogenase complex